MMLRETAILSLLALLPGARGAEVSVHAGTEPMKLSSTGPSSTLPSFLFMAGAEEGGSLYGGFGFTGGKGTPAPFHAPVANCPDEIFANESPIFESRSYLGGCRTIGVRTRARHGCPCHCDGERLPAGRDHSAVGFQNLVAVSQKGAETTRLQQPGTPAVEYRVSQGVDERGA